MPGLRESNLLGLPAFEFSLAEAVYLSQVVGWQGFVPGSALIPLEVTEGGVAAALQFPPPAPAAVVPEALLLGSSRWSLQINPLLAPSMQHLRRQAPEFFRSSRKTLVPLIAGSASQTWHVFRDLVRALEAAGHPLIDTVFLWLPDLAEGDRSSIPEPLTEFIVSMYLRSQGFIVDKFGEALAATTGRPDLFAVQVPRLQALLAGQGLAGRGAFLCEIEGVSPEPPSPASQPQELRIFALEMEKERRHMAIGVSQIERYLREGYYQEGYVLAPFYGDLSGFAYDVGAMTFGSQGELIVRACPRDYSQPESLAETERLVERIVKLLLLKRLPLTEGVARLPGVSSTFDAYYQVDRVTTETILGWLAEAPNGEPWAKG